MGEKKNMLNVKKHDAQRLYSIPKQMKEKSRVILLTCIIKSLPYLWRSFTNHQKNHQPIASETASIQDSFLSGCHLRASCRYAFFDAIKLCIIGDAQVPVETSMIQHGWSLSIDPQYEIPVFHVDCRVDKLLIPILYEDKLWEIDSFWDRVSDPFDSTL